MPDDLKAQTVQWVITTARSLQRLPMFSTISGVDPVQSERELRDVERALAEYRAAPGNAARANVGFFPTAIEIAEQIAANAPLAVVLAKEIALDARGLLAPDIAAWRERASGVFASNDAKEGARAFAEKRRPNFTGT